MDGSLQSAVVTQPLLPALSRRADHLRNALGVLVSGLLAEKDVTDVYLNPPEQVGRPGEVWVVRHGADPAVCGTMAADEALRLITAVAACASERDGVLS
jgi:Flp pilus assembly CpaF family ATPase